MAGKNNDAKPDEGAPDEETDVEETNVEDVGAGEEGKNGEEELSVEELKEELETVRIALKRANRESAKRRLELKQLRETSSKKPEGSGEEEKVAEKLQKEYDKLQEQLVNLQAENQSLKLRGIIRTKAAGLKLPFYSEEALDDAVGRIQTALGAEEYDDDDITAAIKDVAKARPYLFRKAEKQGEEGTGPGTDAAKKGTSDIVVTAEEEADVARRFNIKP